MSYGASCYGGEALDNLSYYSTRPLPTDVQITAQFYYKQIMNSDYSSCNYTTSRPTNKYTISAGETAADAIPRNQDTFARSDRQQSSPY